LFAGLREEAGEDLLKFEGSAATAEELKALLEKEFPFLVGTGFALWVDERPASGSMEIPEDAELALLPPVSGG
tara:strand:- start:740 stop:958 length:219 start_codon:yes stop_codon:yes gene_type:complete